MYNRLRALITYLRYRELTIVQFSKDMKGNEGELENVVGDYYNL